MFAIVRATCGRRSDVCATLGQTLHTYRTSKLRYHAGHRRAPLVVARPRSRSSRAPRDKRKPSRREAGSRVDRARTLLNEKTWKPILRVSATRRTQPGDYSIHRPGRRAFSRNTPSSRCHDAWRSTEDRSMREHQRWMDRSISETTYPLCTVENLRR